MGRVFSSFQKKVLEIDIRFRRSQNVTTPVEATQIIAVTQEGAFWCSSVPAQEGGGVHWRIQTVTTP